MGAAPASALSAIWIALAFAVPVALGATAGILGRYPWVYSTFAERAALSGFFAASAVVIATVGGAALWGAMCVSHAFARRYARPRALLLAWIGLTAVWVLRALASDLTELARSPLFFATLALAFAGAIAWARGPGAWTQRDVTAIAAVALTLAVTGLWLNFVYLRIARDLYSNALNAGALLAAQLSLVALLRTSPPADVVLARATRRAPWLLLGVCALGSAALLPAAYAAAFRAGAVAPPPVPPVLPVAAAPPAPTALPFLRPRNLVLISVDTLRADRLGLYGHTRKTSPQLDRFFARGAIFEHAYAQAPWTLPSHASMLTGQYVSRHGVRFSPGNTGGMVDRLPEDAVTLAERLRAAGLATAAFTTQSFVTPEWGFDQGFDRFETAPLGRMYDIVERVRPWLAEQREPFFLFLHAFDVHKYQPPELIDALPDGGKVQRLHEANDPAHSVEQYVVQDGFYTLTPQEIEYLRLLYDSEIAAFDQQLGRFLTLLEQSGRLADTAVLLTSDHGEEFWGHGGTGHGFTLYQVLLRVPLLLVLPGMPEPRRIEQPVRVIDIAPTLLDLAGVAQGRDGHIDGHTLLPLVLGQAEPDRPVIAEAGTLDTKAALLLDGWKYVDSGMPAHNLLDPRFLVLTLRGLLSPYNKGPELYRLADDPREQKNLARQERERVQKYRELLRLEVGRLRALSLDADSPSEPLSPELRDQLESLGYVE